MKLCELVEGFMASDEDAVRPPFPIHNAHCNRFVQTLCICAEHP